MQIPILNLKAQYAIYKDELMRAVQEVCDSQILCLGSAVVKFEKQAGTYCECKHSVGVSSGTDALLVSLMAAGLGPGDEVITTPFTFFSTAGTVSRPLRKGRRCSS